MSDAIAAVVFDLDGVLVDSESVWDAARREVVARVTAGAGKPTMEGNAACTHTRTTRGAAAEEPAP